MEGQFEDMRKQIKENDKNVQQREVKKSKYEEELANLKETRAKKGKEPPDLNDRIKQANAQVLDLSKKVTDKHQQVQKCNQELRAVQGEMHVKQTEVIFVHVLGKTKIWETPACLCVVVEREREKVWVCGMVWWCGCVILTG